jgi:hypothetical protein
MKLIIATALAVLAVPAIAQDTPTPPAPPPAPMAEPAPPPPAAPGGVVMGPATPVVQPLTDTATAPTDGKVPMCSKTVVEHCMERSNARGERLHSTPPKR